MNTSLTRMMLAAGLAVGTTAFVGCDNDTPAENTQEAMEDAAENTQDAMDDAGDAMKDAADDAADSVDDATN